MVWRFARIGTDPGERAEPTSVGVVVWERSEEGARTGLVGKTDRSTDGSLSARTWPITLPCFAAGPESPVLARV